jgi:ankyrin repeat protein
MGNTPLHCAVSVSASEFVGLLLDSGADLQAANKSDGGTGGVTALHIAMENNDQHLCQLLINNGASVTVADANGDTPFHKAARLGMKDLLPVLASHGADVIAVNNDGLTPFDVADPSVRPILETMRPRKASKVPSPPKSRVWKAPVKAVPKERVATFTGKGMFNEPTAAGALRADGSRESISALREERHKSCCTIL